MRCSLSLLVLFLFGIPQRARAADSLGDRIVAFCKAHKDQQVGDGDCYDLGKYALKEAGARPEFKYHNNPNKGDYVWGKLVFKEEAGEGESGPKREGKVKDVRPGDVIQLRDAKFEGKKLSGKGTYRVSMPHHTAIVSAVENDGKLLRIYHQNFGGKKVVMEATITPEHLTAGWIRIYRPNPK
jgi:hypothetical protein